MGERGRNEENILSRSLGRAATRSWFSFPTNSGFRHVAADLQQVQKVSCLSYEFPQQIYTVLLKWQITLKIE